MADRKPIVWVTQDHVRIVNGKEVPVHDISPAKEFGEIRYVIGRDVKPWNPTEALPQIRAALADFRADIDYLLLIGSPLQLTDLYAMAIDKAYQDGFSHVRRLYWHNGSRKYVELLVELRQIISLDWT